MIKRKAMRLVGVFGGGQVGMVGKEVGV